MTKKWCYIIIPLLVCYSIISDYNKDKDHENDYGSIINFTHDYSTNLFFGFFTTLVFTFIFGFLDNAGLKLGLGGLDRMLKRKNKVSENSFLGNPNYREGIGNTFSDGIGALAGTLIDNLINGIFISESTSISLLSDLIGTIFGCILGITIPDDYLNNEGYSTMVSNNFQVNYLYDFFNKKKHGFNLSLNMKFSYLTSENFNFIKGNKFNGINSSYLGIVVEL